MITTVLTANNDYVFRVAKVAVCKTDEVKLHVGSSPTIQFVCGEGVTQELKIISD